MTHCDAGVSLHMEEHAGAFLVDPSEVEERDGLVEVFNNGGHVQHRELGEWVGHSKLEFIETLDLRMGPNSPFAKTSPFQNEWSRFISNDQRFVNSFWKRGISFEIV